MNFLGRRSILVFILAGFAEASPVAAQSAFTNAIMQARALIQMEIAPKVPGLSVAVAVAGKLVWSEGFGCADLSRKIPVTPATRFRIGSVSKPLTSAGLARLIERGEIEIDAPVQKYLPDFALTNSALTIRRLAGHLSGIRNYRGSEAVSNQPFPNLRAGLKIFENDPLETAPGTKFSYASYNWNVIGVAMEAASRQNFLDYMQAAVFQPLDMTNTRPDLADIVDPQRTQFYETDAEGKFITAPKVDLSYAWPSGGFLSTAEDLARFGSALLSPDFLKPESRRLLFTSQKTRDGQLTHYGVGWFVGKVAYHGGDSIGGGAILLLDPSTKTVVALLTNRGHLALENENGRLKLTKLADQLVFNRTLIASQIAKLFAPSAENLQK